MLKPSDPRDEAEYLRSGPQTQAGPEIGFMAVRLDSTGFQLVFNLLKVLAKRLPQQRLTPEEKSKYFRQRTAEAILGSGFSTGCTDSTLALIALCRAKGLPAKYIELLDRQWLDKADKKQIKGHVIAEVKIDDNWYFVDPIHASISTKLPSDMVVYGRGLDSWDLGITGDNWRERFSEFRKLWQQKKGG